MFAVIFTAHAANLDDAYLAMAGRLRKLALEQYGCREFVSACQGELEIAISYWDDLEAIRAWKQDPLHRQAQEEGARSWYRDYRVQVVEVVREYRSD